MRTQKNSILVLTIFIMAALALFVPGLSIAGSLEPSDPPGPTMKTLDEIPPTWSQTLQANDGNPDGCNSSRFKCVFGDQAVLDKETGLVWEKEPEVGNGYLTWSSALSDCNYLYKVRGGWRLPTVQELWTLIDHDQYNPTLPSGHPFINVLWEFDNDGRGPLYWTSTTAPWDANMAHLVFFGSGFITYRNKDQGNDSVSRYYKWCVRGGQGVDPQ